MFRAAMTVCATLAISACSVIAAWPEKTEPPPRFGVPTARMTRVPFVSDRIMPGTRFHVWADASAARAYVTGERPFPTGAFIVLEPMGNVDGHVDVMQTYLVMRKMAAGYDPEHGDWYYAVRDSRSNEPSMEGPLDLCINCHAEARDRDWVFGIPENARAW